MAENLFSALHAELVRVRELLPLYEAIGPAGQFAHVMITAALPVRPPCRAAIRSNWCAPSSGGAGCTA